WAVHATDDSLSRNVLSRSRDDSSPGSRLGTPERARFVSPMPRLETPALARLRATTLLFGGWIAFFALLNVLSVTLAPASAQRHFEFRAPELVGAILWTVLSIAITEYHRRLRAR